MTDDITGFRLGVADEFLRPHVGEGDDLVVIDHDSGFLGSILHDPFCFSSRIGKDRFSCLYDLAALRQLSRKLCPQFIQHGKQFFSVYLYVG